ncbi:MATE family efflux transporter, partial [Clostridium perfringens]|nr:MATE family efflux transporter [Clostridium perfringens]
MMRKFFNYVIPAVIGMLVTSLYIVVDGMFVGKGVGSNALAAVNIAFPPNLIA